MGLPVVNYDVKKQKKRVSQFAGINENIIISDSEFSSLMNISLEDFPIIKSCDRKTKIYDNENIVIETYKNGMVRLIKSVFKNQFSLGFEYSHKTEGGGRETIYKDIDYSSKTRLIEMGAYIVIFPQKLVFNTHTKEMKAMEKTVVTTRNCTFEPTIRSIRTSSFTKIISDELDFNRYDSVEISGCNDNSFNTTKVILEKGSNYIIVTGLISASFTQGAGLTLKRKVPDMDYVCCHNNRLFGCSSKNHEIYASRLGDPFNFNNFEGISTDSYVASVGTNGDFTACVSYLGSVYFFKENTIHKLFGDKPSNFAIKDYEQKGVIKGADTSLAVIKDTLYYKGREGIYAYDGVTPTLISKNIKNWKFENFACKYKDRYYIGLSKEDKRCMGAYYPEIRSWSIEDIAMNFAYVDEDNSFGIYDGKSMYELGDFNLSTDGEKKQHIDNGFKWYLESGDLLENSLNEKYMSKLAFYFSLELGSLVHIYLKYDDEAVWQKVGSLYGRGKKISSIPINLRRHSKVRYRLEGKNEFKLMAIEKYIEEGSELGVRI